MLTPEQMAALMRVLEDSESTVAEATADLTRLFGRPEMTLNSMTVSTVTALLKALHHAGYLSGEDPDEAHEMAEVLMAGFAPAGRAMYEVGRQVGYRERDLLAQAEKRGTVH